MGTKTLFVVALVLALLLCGCGVSILCLHREMEVQLGIEPVEVRFAPVHDRYPTWVAWTGWDGVRNCMEGETPPCLYGLHVTYTPRADGVAILHELCHLKLGHLDARSSLSKKEMEDEVRDCVHENRGRL